MADTGWKSPGTVVDNSAVGDLAWNYLSYATSSDNNYSKTDDWYDSGLHTTHYLKATNFGFSVPSGATVNGIEIGIEKLCQSGGHNVKDSEVKIVKADGSIGGTNRADTVNSWFSGDVGSEGYVYYGGSSDLWGETWSATDINDLDFGVVLSATATNNWGGLAQVDHIQIKVYYTLVSVVGPFPTHIRVT